MTTINRPVTPQDLETLRVDFTRAVKILNFSDYFERMAKHEKPMQVELEAFLSSAIQCPVPGIISDYDYSIIAMNLFGHKGDQNTLAIDKHKLFNFLIIDLTENRKPKIRIKYPFTFANILENNGYEVLSNYPTRFRINYMKEFLANPTDAFLTLDHSELDTENFSQEFLTQNSHVTQSFIDRYIETAVASGIGILDNTSPQFLKSFQDDTSLVNTVRLQEYYSAYLHQLYLHPERLTDLPDVDALTNAVLRLEMIDQIPSDIFKGMFNPMFREAPNSPELQQMFREFGALNIR